MASIEQMRLRNREVSILFMQQEHANTLKGLHEEIRKLQQKCSELQFKSAIDATYTSQEDEYRDKCAKLEQEVDRQKKAIEEKTIKLEKKEIRIQNLEQQLKAIDKKYKDEVKQKQHIISRLEAEVREKSDQIAQLQISPLTSRTKHLHCADPYSQNEIPGGAADRHVVDQYLDSSLITQKTPSRALRRSTPEHRLSRESSGSSQHSHEDLESPAFMPLPPTGRPGSSGSRSGVRSRRKMITAQTMPHFAEVMARPASAKKLENFQPVDTEEILQIARAQRVDLNLPHGTGPVIPPIKSASQTLTNRPARQSNSAAFQKKSRSSKNNAAKVEVETLAVDQVINTDLRKAQEFNSYTSDV